MATLIIPFIGELTGLIEMLSHLQIMKLNIFLKRFRTSASVRMPPSIWRKMDLSIVLGYIYRPHFIVKDFDTR